MERTVMIYLESQGEKSERMIWRELRSSSSHWLERITVTS